MVVALEYKKLRYKKEMKYITRMETIGRKLGTDIKEASHLNICRI